MKSNIIKLVLLVLVLCKIDASAQIQLKIPVGDPDKATLRGTYSDFIGVFYGMHNGCAFSVKHYST